MSNQYISLNQDDLKNLSENFVVKPKPEYKIYTERSSYQGQKITGLSFPLSISKGSLKISSNEDRLVEQVMEILQTNIGERVYRMPFGIPDLLFESISEAVLNLQIKNQITRAIKNQNIEFDVDIQQLTENSIAINVYYSISGQGKKVIKYVIV